MKHVLCWFFLMNCMNVHDISTTIRRQDIRHVSTLFDIWLLERSKQLKMQPEKSVLTVSSHHRKEQR